MWLSRTAHSHDRAMEWLVDYGQANGWFERAAGPELVRSAWEFALAETPDAASVQPHGVAVLWPLAYSLATFWHGRDSLATVALGFGVASLGPLASLQTCAVPDQYLSLARAVYQSQSIVKDEAEREAGHIPGLLLLLSYVAANDVLSPYLNAREQRADIAAADLALILPIVEQAQVLNPEALKGATRWTGYVLSELAVEAQRTARMFERFR